MVDHYVIHNFRNHPSVNTRFEMHSSDPATPLEGRYWFNTDSSIPYIRANGLNLPLIAKDDNFYNAPEIASNDVQDALLVWSHVAVSNYQFGKYRRISYANLKAQFGSVNNAFKTISGNTGTNIVASGEDTLTIWGDGSVIETSGNHLTNRLQMQFKSQLQHSFFAGPSSGGSGAPSFRKILLSDLPAALPVYWDDIVDKPLVFPSAAHTHVHSDLTDLGDDDHLQYYNETRGDARYALLAHNHTGVYEPVLGNPLVDGYLLSSLIDGTRSWIASPSPMVYPGAGIAFSTGAAWGTSIVGTNNIFPIFSAEGIANSNFSQDANKIINTVNNSAIEFHSLGFYFTHNTLNQFVIGTGDTNLLFLTDLATIVFSKGIRLYSGQTFSAEDSSLSHGKHTIITGGNVSGTGNYNGGDIQFLRGTGVGSGVPGNIYFGDAFTLLPAKVAETNVVYYDTTTGKISYGAVTTGISETVTIITDVRSNAGQMQKKTRTLTYVNGVVTTAGAESAWTDTTDI